MSAWMELVNANGSDEWLEMCSRALEEVQRETSRRNARVIRYGHPDRCPDFADGADWAADAIDPEVTT